MRFFARCAIAATLCAAAACGGGQTQIGSVFTTNWEDDRGASITKLQAKLQHATIPLGADVAVGVKEDGLVGVPLTGGSPWSFKHKLDSRPDIAGNVVVGSGEREIFCLQASTGQLLWKRSTGGLSVIGVGDDGRTTVVTLQGTGGTGSVLLAVLRDGTVVRQLEVPPALGAPAVVAGIAFIPWQGQYVSAYDVNAGEEIARVTLRSQVAAAFTEEQTLFFGGVGVTRFDDKIGGASRSEASTALLPDREVVGTARWLPTLTEVHRVAAGAPDKVRAYARPAPIGSPMGIEDARYYATYFRVVLGLSSANAQLTWVRAFDADILGGAAYRGGLAVCDTTGKVTFLEAGSGASSEKLDLGSELLSCEVQADGLERASTGAAGPKVGEQIADALRIGGSDMVTVQRYLLRELASVDDAKATGALIELAGDPKTSPALMPEVRAMLAARRSGVDEMLSALGRHFDFLHDQLRPPPVGPLADALAAMNEPRAATLLAKQMNDPSTPPEDVRHAATALLTLATPAELPELGTFFALYRCTADGDDLVAAVVTVAETISKIGTAHDKEAIARAVKDPMTVAAVKDKLTALAEGITVPADPAYQAPDDGKKKKPKAAKKG